MMPDEVLEMGAEDEYTEEQEARDKRLPAVLLIYAESLRQEPTTVIDSDLIPCIERASEQLTQLQEKYDKLSDALSEIYSLADVIHPDSDQICGYIDSIFKTEVKKCLK